MADFISTILAEEDPNKWYTSFEFYPPRSDKAEDELMNVHLPAFAKQSPVFLDLTWGAGGRTSDTTMRLSKEMQETYPNIPVNMHLTCTNMPAGLIKEALIFAKQSGIRNILALRGDAPPGEEFRVNQNGFACAKDLVEYIRRDFCDDFCVTVAGYPEGHPSKIADDGTIAEEDYQDELDYLKAKVDAGANVIITQLFYDASIYVHFVNRCREIGINVPILAGLLPITNYASFQRIVKLCKTHVPVDVKQRVEELKDDHEGLKNYGVEQCLSMIQYIRDAGIPFNHLHFYTLNSTSQAFKIMQSLGIHVE
ncbi:putative methylenetetrahydrofolate reductase [Leptomonas seymouri]|uniref:Putative methylenetetrahydrofolate reductase n=1 Tax=Leptomonas seymouri TaxID=5684 RepID=A0A0N1IKP8_LEPSE|nr:putative methylenetetrahydrofolate reductase [Leptomonas seymouri]|eukprot:KPI87053.1 putative methylenetetrahydrofolate reductase [Leptomonas seymouri]